MDTTDLRTLPQPAVPAGRPIRARSRRRATLDADLVVLDLEDAVREEDKAAAREAAIAATQAGFGGRPVAIRVNPTGSRHYGEDVVAVRQLGGRLSSSSPRRRAARQVADAGSLMGKPVLAMIETPRAVIDAAAIAPVAARPDRRHQRPRRRARPAASEGAGRAWSMRCSGSCSPPAPPASRPSTASTTGSRPMPGSRRNAGRAAPAASTASR